MTNNDANTSSTTSNNWGFNSENLNTEKLHPRNWNLGDRKLIRPREGRMLGGVCLAAANYLKIDAAIVRLAMVVLALVTFGTAAVVYAAGWLLIPEEATLSDEVSTPVPPQF